MKDTWYTSPKYAARQVFQVFVFFMLFRNGLKQLCLAINSISPIHFICCSKLEFLLVLVFLDSHTKGMQLTVSIGHMAKTVSAYLSFLTATT